MNTAETEKDTELYDKIETHFENQLERTNFWLSFAEAKNGAIIAINVALIAVLITIFDKAPIFCVIAISCFLASCTLGLISFIPNTKSTLTKFQWADLDCEYNRNMNDPKMMRSDRKIIPDLVIHRRRSNRNNLLVIEFKKKNAETYDKENDRNKLMYLTDQKEDFKYNFGLFVELGSHEVYMEVYQEGNLQTKLNYSITY